MQLGGNSAGGKRDVGNKVRKGSEMEHYTSRVRCKREVSLVSHSKFWLVRMPNVRTRGLKVQGKRLIGTWTVGRTTTWIEWLYFKSLQIQGAEAHSTLF